MKYLTDKEIDAMTDEQKLNALEDFINFDGIAEHVCSECIKADECDGYLGHCPCSQEWSEILTNLLKAQEEIKYARKRVIDYGDENPQSDLFPLTCVGIFEGQFCSVPCYG